MADATNEHTLNVGSAERWVSAIGGGACVTYGLLRRDKIGLVLAALGGGLLVRGSTGHCAVYDKAGISTADNEDAPDAMAPGVRHEAGIKVHKAVTIVHPADELYHFWRDFTNLPRFMNHLEAVTVLDGSRSHWVARAPFGRTVEWDAEIVNEKPGEMIAWRSLPGADVDSAGSVHFKPAPDGRGTEVHVSLSYQPPAGQIGAAIAKLFGEEPAQQIDNDLRHFRNLMETGELPTVEGQSAGKRSASAKMMQAALENKLKSPQPA